MSVMLTITDNSYQVYCDNERNHNELLKTINATVNHELRNPLNSIVAFNMQKEKLYLDLQDINNNEYLPEEDKKNQINEILTQLKEGNDVQKASTKIIQFLIQDLLDYSQINQNKFRQNIQQFDLKNSINEIICIQKMKAESKGIQLVADFSNLNNAVVIHDEQRIQQVLLNLQSNALKFTEKGSVTIKAEVRQENEEMFLNITVTDTGIGIKDEDKDQLFSMFGYIKDSYQMNIHGIGLGLNLSKKIIDQFGGKIVV